MRMESTDNRRNSLSCWKVAAFSGGTSRMNREIHVRICHLGPAAAKPYENRSEPSDNRARAGCGEIELTVEKPRPWIFLIRSVRDRANKWCVVFPPVGAAIARDPA